LAKSRLSTPLPQIGRVFHGNIRKRGSKWQVQIRRAGYSSITKTFHRREEAIAWGRSQEVRLDASEAGIALPVKETLAKLLGRYGAGLLAGAWYARVDGHRRWVSG